MSDHFDPLARKWFNDLYKPKKVDVPETLYHYTDAAGLFGMLSGGAIWLTEARYLNDKTENIAFLEVAKSMLYKKSNSSSDDIEKSLCAKIPSYLSVKSNVRTFIFSLSSQMDDLSQWRGYAHEGKGFTIGFSGESLCDCAISESMMGLAKVDYDRSGQNKITEIALRDFIKDLKKEIAKNNLTNDELIDDAALTFDLMLEDVAARHKHDSFIGENEWRIVRRLHKDNKEISVRSSGLRLVIYLPVTLSDSSTGLLPVKSIGIGPGLDQDDQQLAVETLCKGYGYDIEVYRANSPYRYLG